MLLSLKYLRLPVHKPWFVHGVLVLLLASATLAVFLAIRSSFLRQSLQELEEVIPCLEHSLPTGRLPDEFFLAFRNWVRACDPLGRYRVSLLDTTGQLLADTQIPPDRWHLQVGKPVPPEVVQARERGFGWSWRQSPTLGEGMLFLARRIHLPGSDPVILRVARLDRAMASQLHRLTVLLAAISLILFIALEGLLLQKQKQAREEQQNWLSRFHALLPEPLRLETPRNWTAVAKQLEKIVAQWLETLPAEHTLWRTILASLAEGVLLLDEKGKIRYANQAAAVVLRDPPEKAMGTEYFVALSVPLLISLLKRFYESPCYLQEQLELDEHKFLEVLISPLPADNQPGQGCVVLLKDITELKRINQVRKDFVANVSHELKTPLTVVQGYAEALLEWESANPETVRQYAQKILRRSRDMQALVEDLLQLARVERLEHIDLQVFDLVKEIEDLAPRFRELTRQKNLLLALKLPPQARASGNRQMFRTMVTNLVDNAVKYTPKGGQVEIEIQSRDVEVRVTVRDTGIGIPPEYQERIFERFFRVDPARSRAVGGTGLGLSIVKHMALLQNVKIELHSIPGQGSAFTLVYPVAGEPGDK